jgi:hypothetical protein
MGWPATMFPIAPAVDLAEECTLRRYIYTFLLWHIYLILALNKLEHYSISNNILHKMSIQTICSTILQNVSAAFATQLLKAKHNTVQQAQTLFLEVDFE